MPLIFENFCTVTESVRKGIDVDVTSPDSYGFFPHTGRIGILVLPERISNEEIMNFLTTSHQ